VLIFHNNFIDKFTCPCQSSEPTQPKASTGLDLYVSRMVYYVPLVGMSCYWWWVSLKKHSLTCTS